MAWLPIDGGNVNDAFSLAIASALETIHLNNSHIGNLSLQSMDSLQLSLVERELRSAYSLSSTIFGRVVRKLGYPSVT